MNDSCSSLIASTPCGVGDCWDPYQYYFNQKQDQVLVEDGQQEPQQQLLLEHQQEEELDQKMPATESSSSSSSPAPPPLQHHQQQEEAPAAAAAHLSLAIPTATAAPAPTDAASSLTADVDDTSLSLLAIPNLPTTHMVDHYILGDTTATYTGTVLMETGIPHGSGCMLYLPSHMDHSDVAMYDGQWNQGLWHGYGCLTFYNGDWYVPIYVNIHL
jgi:MORN repeat